MYILFFLFFFYFRRKCNLYHKYNNANFNVIIKSAFDDNLLSSSSARRNHLHTHIILTKKKRIYRIYRK